MNPVETILAPGRNCAAVARADRLKWLIDGEDTFAAIGEAIAGAERQVLLLGWDFHSRVRLWRGDDEREGPRELLALLEARVRERRRLRVHVLGWDYLALYSLEREFFPRLRFGKRTHRRIQFRLDGAHPALASQHQKVIVVDDDVAFVGGFDVTAHRWDTRDHAPGDPRRTTPDGTAYGPFHDVQVAVSGPAAASLGRLARERWQRATGKELRTPTRSTSAWPGTLRPDAEGVEVAIARTQPEYDGNAEVREVERLYLDSIASARDSIYIENQYFTSDRIAQALAARLKETAGPEVVIVGPRRASGWLEQGSMGVLRSRHLASLKDSDTHGRLRCFYPDVPGLGDEIVNVHAKVMVVDDRLARVGSSNLSNRSMGLDTECDLLLDASQEVAWRSAVRSLRDELLAEHLGVARERVDGALAEHGSLIRAIDALASDGRSLRPLEDASEDTMTQVLAAGVAWTDPEAPLSLETLSEQIAGDLATGAHLRWRVHALVGAGLSLLGLSAWLAFC